MGEGFPLTVVGATLDTGFWNNVHGQCVNVIVRVIITKLLHISSDSTTLIHKVSRSDGDSNLIIPSWLL